MDKTSNRLQKPGNGLISALPYAIALITSAIALKVYWGHIFGNLPSLEFLLLTIPFWLVVAFNALPFIIQQAHTKSLSARGRSGELPTPGYFRLRPYDRSKQDREAYHRNDGEHKKVLSWLLKSQEVVHYLTGRSGTGKSSLLNAFVLPNLQEAPHFWRTLVIHASADPLKDLRESIPNHKDIFSDDLDELDSSEALRVALHRACEQSNLPLFIVWDQFEEFLIQTQSHSSERDNFEDFIKAICENPPKNLKIMLVFRTDYLHPLLDGGLPALHTDRNWEEVSPFSDEDSRNFLRDSKIDISEKLLDHIMHVIFEIEETKGLVRPITLNMIGLVLKHSNKSERAHLDYKHSIISLMDNFLRRSLSKPNLRHHIESILHNMLTEDGTKQRMSVEQLAKASQRSESVIRGCLIELGQNGLVRRRNEDEETWEIAHDFVAKQIDLILRKWKPPFFHRFRSQFFYSISMLWLIALFGLLPAMKSAIEHYTISSLTELGGEVTDTERGKMIRFRKHPRLDRTIPLMQRLESFKILDLRETLVTDLSPISQLESLESLILAKTPYFDLSTLNHKNLRELDLSNTGIEEVEGILKLQSLRSLNLSGSKVEHIVVLKGLPQLKRLYLNDLPVRSLKRKEVDVNFAEMSLTELMRVKVSPENVPYLTELEGMPQIEWIFLKGTEIDELEPLDILDNLRGLDISLTQIDDLSPLAAHKSLEHLAMSETYLEDIDVLAELENLNYLDLSSTKVDSLIPLSKLRKLTYLNLTRSDVGDLKPISALTRLITLKVGYTYVSELSTLENFRDLEHLELQGASVKSLQGMPILSKLKILNIADTGIKDLKPLLQQPKLKELDLSYTQIEASPVLLQLEKLEKLTIKDSEFTKEFIETLRAQRPNMAIIID